MKLTAQSLKTKQIMKKNGKKLTTKLSVTKKKRNADASQ
jgi:hypothetical protein